MVQVAGRKRNAKTANPMPNKSTVNAKVNQIRESPLPTAIRTSALPANARHASWNVDHGIDDDIGDVHALWSKVPRHRLGENTLGRFDRVTMMVPLPAATMEGASVGRRTA